MISIEHITSFYPAAMRGDARYLKHILQEYVQLLVLDYLSATPHVRKLAFIGGTHLRLVKGIDRFSEDLDFDCKDLPEDEFVAMSEDVLAFLRRHGLKVETRAKDSSRLTAFRRSLFFPELLFELGLSGHREERFLLKLEAQDQGVAYAPSTVFIKGCGLFFPFPVPPDGVLCSMKIAAMLSRAKGRDFYDVMFLLAQTSPDYDFLSARRGIHNLPQLKAAVQDCLQSLDLRQKQRDFEHLLFHRENSRRILHVGEFFKAL
ncbi:MAG: nucleotidyl transferase AbiEii/AbiGii toxin family protein [Candidatus Marinimicrobia bacterium]|nr:nucleotidyl transferase AbiEii/AbiGii toxin family protein [Candidatus Neomarinimicrobiota bacterium]